ncbi:MAG: sigma-54-dependent Fis family transcriptional regulator [Acidobacteria bacterium]|nr:sigma-54-dependent Fis family transcriptional regulator [Acidobacteriota bacterium]
MRQHSSAELLGVSKEVCELRDEIQRVALCDTKILITGESGVGKDLIARMIHRCSPRVHRSFIALNCAGIPETLLESELFGHVRGSFTGAYRDKPGKLEMANGGSVFLDEVGEMTSRMQGLLLRFLETGELQRVGADRLNTGINVRVIAATNKNLRHMVSQGTFREDLFYRLNVVHLTISPLRERREDIPVLVNHFLSWFSTGNGRTTRPISPEALKLITEYGWPGNVRELANLVERLVVTGRRETITPDELPPEIRERTAGGAGAWQERRRTIVDELYHQVRHDGESFWSAVYPMYMRREITKNCVRELVRRGLQDARGNYKIVARLFNMEPDDYKRFLNFLRKHDCHLPFKEFR